MWKQILPPRIADKFGEVDPYMHALLWARNRLTELVHLARALGGRRGEGETTMERRERQWHRLISKVTSKGSPMTLTLAKEERWRRIAQYIKEHKYRHEEVEDFLATTCEWTDLVIKDKNKGARGRKTPRMGGVGGEELEGRSGGVTQMGEKRS